MSELTEDFNVNAAAKGIARHLGAGKHRRYKLETRRRHLRDAIGLANIVAGHLDADTVDMARHDAGAKVDTTIFDPHSARAQMCDRWRLNYWLQEATSDVDGIRSADAETRKSAAAKAARDLASAEKMTGLLIYAKTGKTPY